MPKIISSNHFNPPFGCEIKLQATDENSIFRPSAPARQIVFLPPGFDRNSLALIKQSYAIKKVAHTCDFRDTPWSSQKTEAAQLLVFDRLGIGLLSVHDPEQIAYMRKNSQRNRALQIIRAESQMQLAVAPES